MSPMSLLNFSAEALQAVRANDQDGGGRSPHGERGERDYAAWFALAMLLVPATLLVLARMH